jgi:hypothetical protein
MNAIATIKNMEIMSNDIVDHILLDFLVGDQTHWKKCFNLCIYDLASFINSPYMRWIKYTESGIKYTDDYTFETLFIQCKEQKDKKAFNKVFKQNMLELQSIECFEYASQFHDDFFIHPDQQQAFDDHYNHYKTNFYHIRNHNSYSTKVIQHMLKPHKYDRWDFWFH